MAVTDLYVVGYLLEATRETLAPLAWHPESGGGYSAELNGVRIGLCHVQSMGWSGQMLTFTRGDDATYVEEPRPVSIFGQKYRCEDDRRLAESLQGLSAAVIHQCHVRRTRAWRQRDSVRQTLYRQVLFGEPENA